ncbi:hypothetical protein NQ315_014721 [Exocentrus adspersus]|uniref:PiggyBac transposable element-derived protein domain-containing protein n=1 Tax=Exocentrus adspersus TaxID=1586481 RepID=A0AAV8VDT8_9CUCU|nr:hypothetical protein NQ315_014721 [Exocentrus adspersus]
MASLVAISSSCLDLFSSHIVSDDDGDIEDPYATDSGSDYIPTGSEDAAESENDSTVFEQTDNDNELQEVLEGEQDQDSEQEQDDNDDLSWDVFTGKQANFDFTGKAGIQQQITSDITSIEIYKLFINKDVLDLIVAETNRYAQDTINGKRLSKSSRLHQWQDTNCEEIEKFLGIVLWMGLNIRPKLQDYWANDPLYENTINLLHQNFQDLYTIGKEMVIDESMVPWRGRLSFRQYIPGKRHKYGVKLFKICSLDGYTWKIQIYCGKSAGNTGKGLGERVVINLCEGLLNQGRILYTDNFYTSVPLATKLLSNKTHLYLPVKRRRQADREQALPETPVKTKPTVVLDYNNGKIGIDKSDQMASYGTSIRKGVK